MSFKEITNHFNFLCPILFFITFLLHTAHSQSDSIGFNCSNTVNYTDNSPFKSNLNTLLSSLYSSSIQSGFSNETTGRNPDQVYGLALCRGDLNQSDCATCLNTSIYQIVFLCPSSKNGTIWYDNCMLRYSYKRFFSIVDTSYGLAYDDSSSVSEQLNYTLGPLMETLSNKAAYSSPLMFAAGQMNYTNSRKLYGLVQCTRDLSGKECYECLVNYCLRYFLAPDYFYNATKKIVTYSCNVRYDSYLFYDELVTGNAAAPAPAPSTTTTNINHTGAGGNETRTIVIIVGILVVAIFCILLSIIYICFRRRRRNRIKLLRNFVHGEERGIEPLLFDFDTLRAATNNFSESNKLGEGGFGSVYEGMINGKEIAVKRLSQSSRQGLRELRNEVAFVAKLQHRNLTKLVGCCLEKHEKLLVYEYLPNLSLDRILFDPVRREQLDWTTRYKIIEGIGKGLLYLHDDSRFRIIHRDLKASNILLDENMNPKISDFGLAKLFDQDLTRGYTSHIAGTYGYMAPEYALHGHFSVKSDVFSYGVMILEIVTGRKNTMGKVSTATSVESDDQEHLITYVWKNWSRGCALQVLDSYLEGRCILQEALRCIHVGILCVQKNASERPSISDAVLMLGDQSVILPTPSKPAFVHSVHGMSIRFDVDLNDISALRTNVSRFTSVNTISETEIEPR